MSEGAEREEILALAGPLPPPDLDSLMAAGGLVLLLSGVRYPANAGFVLRSAEVAGAAGVVLDTDWSASAREEASRVSIRADRFFSVLEASTEEAFEAARRTARRIVAVETVGGAEPWSVDLCGPIMLVLGSEAKGVPERFLEQADAVVRIPSRGFIPSYNVQAATGILLGEWLRQTITVGAVPLSRSTR
jgi:tRNA G18 (ribose-2'-O)-methylase SpoU